MKDYERERIQRAIDRGKMRMMYSLPPTDPYRKFLERQHRQACTSFDQLWKMMRREA